MASNQEFSKFEITSIKDPKSGGYSIASYDKDLRAILNAIKSALPKDAFLSVGEKELSKQGKLKIDVYTHKEDANLVRKAIDERITELHYKGSTDLKYDVVRKKSLTTEDFQRISNEDKKDRAQSLKHTLGAVAKVAGILTILTDITRRILSSVLTMATATVRDATTAHNLGMSYSNIRGLSNLEVAHGLSKGTITGALTDIQSKFGNITSLDDKALDALALVMGSKIENLVRSGIGGDRPEELLGTILDSYMARANAGYNSVGQYVGEAEARRELYSQLQKVSPQIADLFATMLEERNNVNSIYRKQADTYDEWKKLFSSNRGGYTTADYGVLDTLGQYTNQIAGIVEQLKQGIAVKLAPALTEALRKISNWRIGMSQEDSWETDEKNKQANRDFIAQIDEQLKLFPEIEGYDPLSPNQDYRTRMNQAYRTTLLRYRAEAEAENAKLSGNANVTRTLNEMVGKASTIAQSDYESLYVSSVYGAPYSTETMWEVANRYLTPEEIESERAKVKQSLLQSKINDELEARRKKKAEIEKQYAGRPYGEIRKALQDAGLESAPYEVTTGKGFFKGKKTVIDDYTKDLTDTEKQSIMNELDEQELDDALIQSLFSLYGESRGLDYSAYRRGKEALKKEANTSEDFALSLLLSDKELFTRAQGKLGTYGLVGTTDASGVYKIVLDINRDGTVDKSDIILWEGQGFSGFEGQFNATATVGNKDIKLNYNNAIGTSASNGK